MSRKTMHSFRLSARAVSQLDEVPSTEGIDGTRTDIVEAGIALVSFLASAAPRSVSRLAALPRLVDVPAHLDCLVSVEKRRTEAARVKEIDNKDHAEDKEEGPRV